MGSRPVVVDDVDAVDGGRSADEVDPGAALSLATAVSAVLLPLSLLLAQAATAQTLGRIAAGEPTTVADAYRRALARAVPLIGTALLALAGIGALVLTIYLSPLTLLLACVWALYVPVTQLEDRAGWAALRRSWQLVRPQFLKVAALLAFGALLTAMVGGLAGVLPLLVAQMPFLLVNLIPGVVAALLGPFTSLLLGYAYFHGVAAQTQPEETAAISAS